MRVNSPDDIENPDFRARLKKALAISRGPCPDANIKRCDTDSVQGNEEKPKVRSHSPLKDAQRNTPASIQGPVFLKFTHYRHRTPDLVDAIFIKFIVDSLVVAKILEDDRGRYIPEKPEEEVIVIPMSEQERTVMEIYEYQLV